MFKAARFKLTAWYLLIIMGVSLSFSGVIYVGVNRELSRLQDYQRVRIQGIVGGFPAPYNISPAPDIDAVSEARARIIMILTFINVSILIVSGLGGYFLAGQTLEPIAEMVGKQKEFVGSASHELRTPLTALMTEIEVFLRDKKMNLDDAKKLLGSNLEEVKKMKNLSNYLLRLNKIEDPHTQINFKRINLKEVADSALNKIEPISQKAGISVRKNLKDIYVNGDKETLTEAVIILVDNAIKYGKKGKRLVVRTKKGGILEVQDFGIGIAKKDIPHIFERFYRADSSRSRFDSDGYGLGLSIAKAVVEAHGGKIEVVSKIDKGTTFKVII